MVDKADSIRVDNSKRNIYSSLLRRLLVSLFSFVVRSVVIYRMGVEYQGVSGLFSSILQVLNMSELGISTAVTYVLYKPVSLKKDNEICELLAFLKKAYTIIGIIILVSGLAVLPFIEKLIKGNYPQSINIYYLYLIYLLNTVLTYFVYPYRSTYLTAIQRIDIVNNVYSVVYAVSSLIQISLIVITGNYYLFAIVMLFFNLVNNLSIEIISRKKYTAHLPKGQLDGTIKQEMIRHIKAIFINQIGDVSRNSFDCIVLSIYLGLSAVTVYGNYYCIYAAIYGLMGGIIGSIRASVGNSLVEESVEKNYRDMLHISFVFMWIAGWCTVCMFVLYQPFMLVWMKRRELLLSNEDMTLFCLYFYVMALTYTKNLYLEAYGLFHESRILYIVEALGNLILNFLFGRLWGVSGILIATISTILLFNFFGGAIILFKHYYNRSMNEYIMNHVKYFIITSLICVLVSIVAGLIDKSGGIPLLSRSILCITVPNIIYFCVYRNDESFKYIVNFFMNRRSRRGKHENV